MNTFFANNLKLKLNEGYNAISSLKIGERECCVGQTPLFVARLRNKNGDCLYIDSTRAKSTTRDNDSISYGGFDKELCNLEVTVRILSSEDIKWYVSVDYVPDEYAIEWIELPKIRFPRLIDNDASGGKILFPYDEGVIITDEIRRENGGLPHREPEYPSSGAYGMFPNKVCSQFMAYLFNEAGLYIGAHDTKRGLKSIDFYPNEEGVMMQMRLFSGADFGEGIKPEFPIIWRACSGEWRDAAEIYRGWFENNLPNGVIPTVKNKALPKWYEESPLVITYPVRGIHDMDKMEPNSLFPYTNALPILNKIKKATDTRIMALLMHWEGTAPWAPPYVWPPYGGEALFNEFKDELHKNGDLLGVYCSGFGYTLQSNLIDEYNNEEEIKKRGLLKAMCHSPKNEPEKSIICTYQRQGYDICPASKLGRELLMEAYTPLFKSGVDYAQILDQNHGGGQYLCYAKEHDHPPMPGEWMTSNMQNLLSEWNKAAPNMLFGCESAAAEPFIGNLMMSDNRFELNYTHGTPVPVFAYIYHEYLRNFMGNQVGCSFDTRIDTLRYRIGYSFSIGDLITLTLSPSNDFMTHWGTRDFDNKPDMEKTLKFIKNLNKFYNEKGKKYLYAGKMSNSYDIECGEIIIPLADGKWQAKLPRLLSSSWKAENGKTAYIVVNPEEKRVSFKIGKDSFEVEPLNATLVEI